MAWIESHSILIEHPKVREVARLLSISSVQVIGHLHCLWHKVIELREDGDITSWTENDIAYYARWEGDVNLFYQALQNRFIDEKRGMKLIHDWLDYAGRYLTAKYRNSNPKLLKDIEKKHSPKGRTKGSPKGRTEDRPPNHTLPNQDNHTLPKLPEWVPSEAWDKFIEMRRMIKAAMTEHAKDLAIRELDKLRKDGHDPTEVLNRSIMYGWKGLFPLNNKGPTPKLGTSKTQGNWDLIARREQERQEAQKKQEAENAGTTEIRVRKTDSGAG